MKITTDKMNWRAANDPFPPIKSQSDIDEMERWETTWQIIADMGAVIAIIGAALALMYAPEWVPHVAAWWGAS